jgi:hypothetical protein
MFSGFMDRALPDDRRTGIDPVEVVVTRLMRTMSLGDTLADSIAPWDHSLPS